MLDYIIKIRASHKVVSH